MTPHLQSGRPEEATASARGRAGWAGAGRWRLLLALAAGGGGLGVVPATAAPDTDSRIVNFSARAAAGSGDQTLMLGFVVRGQGGSFLLRAAGPALRPFGLTGELPDPRLTLYSGIRPIATNDNWTADAAVPATGAFPFPAGSRDAALLSALDRGAYTAHVTGAGASGVALAELYVADFSPPARLVNVSARAQAGTGNASFITGLVIDGNRPKTVLIRAIGPSLAGFGVGGVLSNPKLEVYQTGAAGPFAVNDDWAGAPLIAAANAQSGAFGLAADSKDAALLLTLAPGSYTARVSGADGGTGAALLEVYDEPLPAWPILQTSNVIYQHGDLLKYDARGTYFHADGSRTVVTSGWLRIDVVDEGLTNPFNHNVPVLSLIESLMYEGYFAAANGEVLPIRTMPPRAVRLFVQDEQGTIKYQGDRVAESFSPTGTPIYSTYWFVSPLDYIQFVMPLAPGDTHEIHYDRRTVDGTMRAQGRTVTHVEGRETVSTPLGDFDAFRMTYDETSENPDDFGRLVTARVQDVHPALGIVRFEFASRAPGDTGILVQGLSDTNIPFQDSNYHSLTDPGEREPLAAGHRLTYTRSGYYTDDSGTVEEISGSRTVELLDEGITNPLTGQPMLTERGTDVTTTVATTMAGISTTTTHREVDRHYIAVGADLKVIQYGESGPDGRALWYSAGYTALAGLNTVGDSNSATIVANQVSDGRTVPAFTITRDIRVASLGRTSSPLGTFQTYRLVVTDSDGKREDRFAYPRIGIVRYRYEPPAGKHGYVNLTLSATNIRFQ